MKVEIIKFLSSKGKILEMRKDNFKGRDLPENIIEEYEVEIKGQDSNKILSLDDLKRKYANGNYIIIISCDGKKWETRVSFKYIEYYKHIRLIHNKHKDILEAYFKKSFC